MAVPLGMFSADPHPGRNGEGKLELSNRTKDGKNGCRARHVVFHSEHARRGLQGKAARVKRDSLTNEGDVALSFGG